MSSGNIPEGLVQYFKDLAINVTSDEVFTSEELYEFYKNGCDKGTYIPCQPKHVFKKTLRRAPECGVDLSYCRKSKGWKLNPGPTVENEQEGTSMNDDALLSLMKSEISVAMQKVASQVTPDMLQNLLKPEMAKMVKEEFSSEVLPVVLKNLESLVSSAKEELRSQIQKDIDPTVIKQLIVSVMRDAFELQTPLDVISDVVPDNVNMSISGD